jgi:hypothetical protein
MKTSWITILIAGLSGLAATAKNPQPPSTSGDPALSVLVYDYAGLKDNTMNEVENLTSALLERAGIRTQWVYCLGHQAGARPALCDADSQPGVFVIRILTKHSGQANKLGDPLGAAVIGNGFASLFATEVRKYADHNGLSEGCLMAYAAAHEIGHLLLGENHAPSGLMRAVWSKEEYREMAQRWLGFSAEERQALRQALLGPAVAGLK